MMGNTGVILLFLLSLANGGKILLIAVPGISHVHYMSTAGRALIDNGHEVHLILPTSRKEMIEELSPFVDSSVTVHTCQDDMEEYMADETTIKNVKNMVYYSHKFGLKPIISFRVMGAMFVPPICHNLLRDEDLFEKLKNLKFDFILIDGFPATRCLYVLPYRLGIPYASLVTQYEPWQYGIPALPSFVPLALEHEFTEKMTFIQRVRNYLAYIEWHTIPLVKGMSGYYTSHFAPEKPYKSPNQIAAESAIWFINTDIAIDYPRPTLPHVIEVGGLTTKPPSQPLPKDFQSFMDSSGDDGVILVSFGSTPGIPDELECLIHDTILKSKQHVIWKTSQYNVTSKSVITSQWIPQNAILAHPKTKLFITHGGNNGQFEALYHAVPMITFPLFTDQFYNARRGEYKGYGVIKETFGTTVDELLEAIEEVIRNPVYKENISRGSKIFKSHAMDPRERLVYWIEHVMKFGSDHLRSYGLEMPWYQYWMVDIVVFVFFSIIIVMYLMYFAISACFKCCCGKSRKPKNG